MTGVVRAAKSFIRVTQDRDTDWKGLDATSRARYMWRAALAAGSTDTARVFEQVVRREVERMLEEGAPVSAIAAFQSAAAELQSDTEAYRLRRDRSGE